MRDLQASQEPTLPQIAPTLRPYQADVIARVALEIAAGRRRILLVAPTGAGKTIVAATLIAQDVAQGRRVLFLAHRRELIQQASAKLYAVGVDHGIVQAGFPTRPGAKVQVASIPTLHRRAVRSTVMDLPPANLVVVDEAHHVRARSRSDSSRPSHLGLKGWGPNPNRGEFI